jgi:hypothetical protein
VGERKQKQKFKKKKKKERKGKPTFCNLSTEKATIYSRSRVRG